jgi:hypothetical protein
MSFAFTFFWVALFWVALAAYYAWRYRLRRKNQSLAIAAGMLGWPVMVARELHWLARVPTAVLVGAALTIGAWGVYVVFRWESQRAHPFR